MTPKQRQFIELLTMEKVKWLASCSSNNVFEELTAELMLKLISGQKSR